MYILITESEDLVKGNYHLGGKWEHFGLNCPLLSQRHRLGRVNVKFTVAFVSFLFFCFLKFSALCMYYSYQKQSCY